MTLCVQSSLHSQIAAREGHLDLCRLLLQEASYFFDDAALISALRSSCAIGSGPDLMEAFYKLFVAEHGLCIDLEHSDNDMHTRSTLDIVLASQPYPINDAPFAQRFSTATRSFGWPADAFLKILHHDDPTELVTMTTDDGKTALHWVAEHLGEWWRRSFYSYRFLWSPEERAEEYAKLATELISTGANVHALYHQCDKQIDPFMSLLECLLWYRRSSPWQPWTLHYAISRWGQALVEGGIHLPDYVAAENNFLQSVRWNNEDIVLLDEHNRRCAPVALRISEDSELVLDLQHALRVEIWQARQIINLKMPGTWLVEDLPEYARLPETIIWKPTEMDECNDIHWTHTGNMNIQAKADQVKDLGFIVASEQCDLFDDAHQQELQGTQDDHGLITTILQRHRQSRLDRGSESSRRRSASEPAYSRIFSTLPLPGKLVFSPSNWRIAIHKCPLDSRWRRCALAGCSYARVRLCLRGRCHELKPWDHDLGFEAWFLRNEAYAQVALRYAQRLCPEQLDVVEATVQKARDRSRLPM